MDEYQTALNLLSGPVGTRVAQRAKKRGDEETEKFISDQINDLDCMFDENYIVPQREQRSRYQEVEDSARIANLNTTSRKYNMALGHCNLSITPTRAEVNIRGKSVLVYDQRKDTPNSQSYWQDANLTKNQENEVRSILIVGVTDLIYSTLNKDIKTQVEGIMNDYENISEDERVGFHIDWGIPLPFENERVNGKSLQEIAESHDLRGTVEERVHSKFQDKNGSWRLSKALSPEYYDFVPLIYELRWELGLLPKDNDDIERFVMRYDSRRQRKKLEQEIESN